MVVPRPPGRVDTRRWTHRPSRRPCSSSTGAPRGQRSPRTPRVRLAGLMGYEGRQRAGGEGRAALIGHAYAMLAEAKRAFGRAGLPVDTVSSAGTSTLREALADPVITEIQAGTYALMEADL